MADQHRLARKREQHSDSESGVDGGSEDFDADGDCYGGWGDEDANLESGGAMKERTVECPSGSDGNAAIDSIGVTCKVFLQEQLQYIIVRTFEGKAKGWRRCLLARVQAEFLRSEERRSGQQGCRILVVILVDGQGQGRTRATAGTTGVGRGSARSVQSHVGHANIGDHGVVEGDLRLCAADDLGGFDVSVDLND